MADTSDLEDWVNKCRERMVEAEYGKGMIIAAYDGISELLLNILHELREANDRKGDDA